jgi:hypothetical protein
MPISSIVKNFRDGTIVLKDGTGTPIALTVEFEAGDFSISGMSANSNTEATTYLDRGVLGSVRLTNQTFPTFSFTAQMTDLSDATNKTLYDAVNKKNTFAAAVSTVPNGDVYGLDVVLSVEGSNFGDPTDHVLTMVGCRMTIDFAEGDPNSFTINGTVYGSITAA